jgi:hypothetical protein
MGNIFWLFSLLPVPRNGGRMLLDPDQRLDGLGASPHVIGIAKWSLPDDPNHRAGAVVLFVLR